MIEREPRRDWRQVMPLDIVLDALGEVAHFGFDLREELEISFDPSFGVTKAPLPLYKRDIYGHWDEEEDWRATVEVRRLEGEEGLILKKEVFLDPLKSIYRVVQTFYEFRDEDLLPLKIEVSDGKGAVIKAVSLRETLVDGAEPILSFRVDKEFYRPGFPQKTDWYDFDWRLRSKEEVIYELVDDEPVVEQVTRAFFTKERKLEETTTYLVLARDEGGRVVEAKLKWTSNREDDQGQAMWLEQTKIFYTKEGTRRESCIDYYRESSSKLPYLKTVSIEITNNQGQLVEHKSLTYVKEVSGWRETRFALDRREYDSEGRLACQERQVVSKAAGEEDKKQVHSETIFRYQPGDQQPQAKVLKDYLDEIIIHYSWDAEVGDWEMVAIEPLEQI